MRVGEPGRGILDDSARPGRRVDGGESRGGGEADWFEESQPPRLRARLHPPTCEGRAGILTRAALSRGLSPADPETTSARTMTTGTLHVPPARRTRWSLPPLALYISLLTVAGYLLQFWSTLRSVR